MKREFYNAQRVLFTIQGCEHCNVIKQFIEGINMKLKPDKRIRSVDCTKYYDYGIIENPLIIAFSKYLKGGYPVLFFEGFRLDGATTRLETEAFIKSLTHEDLIIPETNNFMFNQNCSIVTEGVFKGRIHCQ